MSDVKSSPCKDCRAICCRYVALPIDEPTTAGDFDDIRWYISHRKVSVFIDDGDWYICFKSPCKFLTKDNRCSIYENRPRICRKYKTTNCEFTGEGKPYDIKFDRPEQITEYAKKYLREKYSRRKKRAKGKRGKRA